MAPPSLEHVSKAPSCATFLVIVTVEAGQSMDQHFLTSYHHAILSIILAQFSPKGFLDGMEGIVRLVKDSPYLQVCSVLLFCLTVLRADTVASSSCTCAAHVRSCYAGVRLLVYAVDGSLTRLELDWGDYTGCMQALCSEQ